MKILQIGITYKEGGPGYTAANVHNALLNIGESSKVFYSTGKSEKDIGVETFEKRWETILRKIIRRLLRNMQILATTQTISLIRMIKKYNPDIIHLRIIHHGFINYFMLFKFLSKAKKPIVITMHDMWIATGGCYHYHNIGCTKYQQDCKKCPKTNEGMDNFPSLSSYFRKKKEKYLASMKEITVIAVSKWVNEEIRKTYLKNYKTYVISNAVDIEVFKPTDSGYFNKYKTSINKKIIIGVAAKWGESKGFLQFCQLAKLLGNKFIIILVGNPPNGNVRLPENLYIIGRIDNRVELAKAYTSADVFVHLSYEETFGMVIAEAACCGKRVIGYNSTGISEVVQRARGILIEKGDIDRVVLSVKDICNKNDKLSQEELLEVRKSFSVKVLQDKHIELYRSIYNRQQHRSVKRYVE